MALVTQCDYFDISEGSSAGCSEFDLTVTKKKKKIPVSMTLFYHTGTGSASFDSSECHSVLMQT